MQKWPLILLRSICGAILILSAILKSHQLGTYQVVELFVFPIWMWAALILIEAVLGSMLLWGVWPGLSFRIAFLAFFAFSGFSLYFLTIGEVSCGCFGRILVPPGVTFAIDVVLTSSIGFCLWKYGAAVAGSGTGRNWEAVTFGLCLGVSLSLFAGSHLPGPLSATGEVQEGVTAVAFKPKDWIGQAFPLARWIEDVGGIETGRWKILLFRPSCQACEAALKEFVAESTDRTTDRSDLNYAVINTRSRWKPSLDNKSHLAAGNLKTELEWMIRTPVIVELNNSRVISSTDVVEH